MTEPFDSRAVVFAFAPGAYVTVTLLGNAWKGRVTRSIHTASARGFVYEVEFMMGDELKCKEFYEDELEVRAR